MMDDTERRAVMIALVDGDARARRERQLMLRAERFDVRAYASDAALLADPQAQSSACIIADIGSADPAGYPLLQRMRAGGWRGTAILLDAGAPGDGRCAARIAGDLALPRSIADRPLLQAIHAELARVAPPAVAIDVREGAERTRTELDG